MAVLMVGLTLATSTAAAAEPPAKLWKGCLDGRGADQCKVPRGIVSDPVTGHLYVADQSNSRVVELTPWGEFIKAWGWGVKNGASELQVCTKATDCLSGLFSGGRSGELNSPMGIAVDSAGGIYVVDKNNNRVQKFDREGHFVLMFGGKVNKTRIDEGGSSAEQNLCTEASGDICQAGTTGSGKSQFSGWPPGSYIAIDPADTIYVGDQNRIQKFNAKGEYLGEVGFGEAAAKNSAFPATGEVAALAADPANAGQLYVALVDHADVFKLDSATAGAVCTAKVTNPRSVATDYEGNLYAIDLGEKPQVLEFNSGCLRNEVPPFGGDELTKPNAAPNPGIATATSPCYEPPARAIYVANSHAGQSFVRAYGPPPDKLDGEGNAVCPPPAADPSIESQLVSAAGPGSSTVVAEINPHFWPDTTYYVEYGTGKCSEGGCDKALPLSPAALGGGITEEEIATAGVTLPELAAETTYHYRFVAQSSGGGPVYGIDPDAGGPEEASFGEGEEGEFTTFSAEPPPESGCPNPDFHTGAGANLPDCRAYEQVSPRLKGGFDIDYGPMLASPGAAVAYTSLGAFAGSPAGAMASTYASARSGGDWQTDPLSPPYDPSSELATGKVMGASGDLTKQLVATNAKLTPEAVEGDPLAVNIYVHDSAEGSYQYVATSHSVVQPGGVIPNGAQGQFLFWARFVGASQDGSHFIFMTPSGALGTTPDSPANDLFDKLYDFDTASGQLSYVGVLPDGSTGDPVNAASVGAGASTAGPSFPVEPFHPVSADGRRVYWNDGSSRLYLRLNPGQPESARQQGAASGTGDLLGAAAGSGKTTFDSFAVTKVETSSGRFGVGQQISDSNNGIPSGTTIAAIQVEEVKAGKDILKLTLSAKATKTKTGDLLSGAASETVLGLVTKTGAFVPGQRISGPGIAAGTTVLAAEAGALTLSAKALATEADGPLSATSECTEPAKACTIAVSEAEDGSIQSAELWGASLDGGLAFLTSAQKLTADASPTGADLYRYDAEADALTDLTPNAGGAGVQKVLGVSSDGAYAYFLAGGALAPGASAAKPNLYAWHEGQIRLIATLASKETQFTLEPTPNDYGRVSSNGRYLGFLFGGRLAGPHPKAAWPFRQAYLYDYGADSLECASCPPGGYASADVGLHGVPTNRTSTGTRSFKNSETGLTRNVSDGGQFFFQSKDRLLLRDTNEKYDVYEYAGGQVHLISSGQDLSDSYFGDATPSGSDAFFTTREGLVGQDTDPLIDLYDARVGGGLASQLASARGAVCQGDGCQGPFTSPPPGAGPGTSSFEGAGNPPPPAQCKKGFARKGARCVKRHSAKQRKHGKRGRDAANHNRRSMP
jgi:DNA-binding beta-propeller fold protein YncE